MKWAEWIKKYYNSISRQSGIVHKDKAMRQLDLDLWEMNWLVAAAAQQQHFFSFQLVLPNGRAEEKKFVEGSAAPSQTANWKFAELFGAECLMGWNVFLLAVFAAGGGYGRCSAMGSAKGKTNARRERHEIQSNKHRR